MAGKNFAVQLDVDSSGAITNIEKFNASFKDSMTNADNLKSKLRELQKQLSNMDPNSKAFKAVADEAGKVKDQLNDAAEAVRANAGPAFETLGNNFGLLTSRLANLDFEGVGQSLKGMAGSIKNVKFSDLTDGIKSIGASFATLGKALLTNPIFLIGAAIAAVVLNFKELSKLIDGVSSEQTKLLETQQKSAEASKEQLSAVSEQENILKLQGKSEKEILEIKLKAVDAAILAQETAIATQRTILEGQVEASKRNKEILEGIFKFLTAPLQLLLMTVDKIAGTNYQAGLNDAVSNLVFDPKQVEEEGQAALKEQEKQLIALQNQRAGFILSTKAIDKTAADERQKARMQEIEDAKKVQAEIFKLQQATNKLIADDRESERAREAEARLKFQEEQRAAAIKEIEDQQALRFELMAEGIDKEIALADEKYIRLRELAHGNAALEQELAEANAAAVADIEKKYAEQRLADDQRVQQARVQVASSVVGSLIAITESFTAKNKKQAKAQFEINKGLQIASAIIDTYKSATGAYASLAPIPTVGPILGAIAAAAAVAAGLAQVNKIRQTKFDGGGGGGGGVSAGGGGGGGAPSIGAAGANVGTPQFNPFAQNIANRPPQVQAYVLSGSVQDEQERRQKIEDMSRLN